MDIPLNLTNIIIAIIGLFATGFVVRVAIKKISKNNNNVVIKNNKTKGGDIAGRDINK